MNIYLFLSLVTAVCFGLQFESISHVMIWQADAIANGQWWRIVTGNLTHTNFTHLMMNLLGLWVISYLFHPKTRHFAVLTLLISIWIGISLLFTDMSNYLGLSGTLHGLFAFYALKEALGGRKSSWLLVLGVILKVVSEQLFGAPDSTAEMIHARVAIEAHLSGLLAGITLSVIEYINKRLIPFWKMS
ncbi:rhombosortase [Vibrio ziniensis]|uniref:Rhombosortase n=1 Tax=Vibrio ziniensis TaxID=2711221 RepID=A0A6G7CJN8_9VIBR|nr:rhombosortase [Vibrio ziniensis]QIH42263.1 rhombosortase [Vibrio ziniensis]